MRIDAMRDRFAFVYRRVVRSRREAKLLISRWITSGST